MSTTPFDELSARLPSGVPAVLETLAERLRREGRYHELFEALKMQVRQRLGLPPAYRESGDDLPEPQRRQLEEGLIDACREVGTLLVRSGKLREGWLYLRPVGDKRAALALLGEVQPDEDNYEEFIEVALHEGVDAARGFAALLEHYGVCNAITNFDSTLTRHPKPDRRAAAEQLVRRLHRDLLENIKGDIVRQEGTAAKETTLAGLVADRDWMFGEGSYHIDTTHLAAVVRSARLLDNPELLRLALDLTAYGRRLHAQFQYQAEEPFADQYPANALYFQALLGENVEAALAYFADKARRVDVGEHGSVAIETYIELLSRLGRHREALDTALTLFPDGVQPLGIAPSLLELAANAGDYDRFLAYVREKGDLVSFATGLVEKAAR